MAEHLIRLVITVTLALGFIGVNFMFLVWLERKISARMQLRVGPYVVGYPHGWLQLIADALKLFSKEDIKPKDADYWLWHLAPVVIFAPAVLLFYVLPLGPNFTIGNDLDFGLVYVAAVTAISLIAIFMAGWGSNSKYSLLGAMRSGSQVMAYEIPLVISMLTVAMMAGSLNLREIVEAQRDYWFIFPGFIAFIVFFISALAELNRKPFDLTEAESELVAGYQTEYSGIRWGMFMFAEYTNMVTMSAVAAVMFFGGWLGPPILPPWAWVVVKAYALVMVMMWVRWTLPRIRVDHLLDLGWKFLLPVSLINFVITSLFVL